MAFALGKASQAKLDLVRPQLARVVRRAITITTADFTVFEAMRTLATQKEYLRRGVTKTLNSRHLTGDAVDLVPWVSGGPRWEWPPIYNIAAAMREAAVIEGVALRWGGVWDRRLADLPANAAGIKRAVEQYCARHPGPDFLDGPHYELVP
jgi:peptidoglycan L-alanyl-D-glutamate endopeptidase CwlK